MLHHRAVRKANSTKYSPWHDSIRIRQDGVFYSAGLSSILTPWEYTDLELPEQRGLEL